MAPTPLTLPLIFGILMRLADADTSASESPRVQFCNFNAETRTYNISDLLQCMNELAGMILLQQNANQNRVSNRVYQDTRQSHPDYAFAPDYSIPSSAAAPSSHYAADTISSLLSGGVGLALPSFPNFFGFGGFGAGNRPGFNLFRALSSIAQYDDLKCIPRILCQVASGSIPGSFGYNRQTSSFQDSGLGTLVRLLTAFDLGGSSPILTFGRAALIGYTNRGKPHSCYRAYPRCPQNPDQLISYLNNYNGGFFRFFGTRDLNHYRPQYSSYYGYHRNSDAGDGNVQPGNGQLAPQAFLGPEADRTGTGKLTFDNHNFQEQERDYTNTLSSKQRESQSGKVVFPRDKQERRIPEQHRVAKSLNTSGDLNISHEQKASSQTDYAFFYNDGNQPNTYADLYNHINDNQKPGANVFEVKRSDGRLSLDTYNKEASKLVFPNN